MENKWKISPSDLTFLWEECPRCFYLKIIRGFDRPRQLTPKIFNRIDKIMKDYYEGKMATDLSPALPEGVARFGEKWVKSKPIFLQQRCNA